jgi:hypothetical protein
MIIQNNKQDFVNVIEQSNVFKLLQFYVTMEGLRFKSSQELLNLLKLWHK